MSSNIYVQRICQHCNKEFTARTTVTKYCSDTCSKRAYKLRKRNEKVETSHSQTQQVKAENLAELKTREFLSVTQVSKLIGCSRQNVYKLINSGKLEATNLLVKKTIVKRSDVDKLFEKPKPKPKAQMVTQKHEPKQIDISECYTLKEIKEKFGVSESTIQQLVKRHNIPKLKVGWYVYVPKSSIDALLSIPKRVSEPSQIQLWPSK